MRKWDVRFIQLAQKVAEGAQAPSDTGPQRP